MSLVGKSAPQISAQAVHNGTIIEQFHLPQGHYTVLFFYPLDFTFVCPTELHAFQQAMPEFTKRGAALIGCSVDSAYCHLAWLNTPKANGGIQGITYPLIADLKKEVARAYGVLKEEAGVAYRGLFLIDRQGIVRHQLVNDLPLGRSVEEALRLLDALIFHETHGEVCPANWQAGSKGIQATREAVSSYLEDVFKFI